MLSSAALVHYNLNADMNDSVGSANLTQINTPTYVAGKIGNAVNLVAASSQYGHRADAIFDRGDTDWHQGCWVRPVSLPADGLFYVIASKMDAVSDNAYTAYLITGGGLSKFGMQVFDGTGTLIGTVDADNFGAVSINTWYYVDWSHSATNNQVSIGVNGGTPNVAATTGAAGNSAADFQLGAVIGVLTWDGQIDSYTFFSRELTQYERYSLVNHGNGLDYPFKYRIPQRALTGVGYEYRPDRKMYLPSLAA